MLGRVTGYTAPEDSVSYTYDVNGNVLTVTDKNGTVTRTYDALNRVSSCTDTYGKTITYMYDAAGNLQRMVYPDNTVVTYEYDENNNLTKVTDWAGRVTAYTYDVNNRVVGVTKPDGSVTTTVYDDKQRITSTVEKTVSGAVITGFEYTYDELGRISTETHLAENTKLCYTYDNLSRVTVRTTIHLADNSETRETFTYDGAGNITGASAGGTFVYDTNNRLTAYNGQVVTYDQDGNMLSAPLNSVTTAFEYDSANRLVRAGDHAYTYNGEDVRIRNRCTGHDTTYTYNTNAKLSQLLMKTTNGVVTKYVYGLGLIGEEKQGCFKTYHFDYRGSTVAITASNGQITDTFQYDTYGKLMGRTGSSFVIFGYNGKDGVVTDKNGLIYMRARYYSPELRRFVNADILAGEISNAVTLNRYAYANGNPVSNVDPFGLSSDIKGTSFTNSSNWYGAAYYDKNSVVVVDEEIIDFTFGLDLVKISYTQTVTTVNEIKGTPGDLFEAYAYREAVLDNLDSNINYGFGLEILYVLGFDINVKFLGVSATLSRSFGDQSVFVNADIDVFNHTSVSLGHVVKMDDGSEINLQIGIEGNTGLVLSVVGFLLTGTFTPNSSSNSSPNFYPQPATAFNN